MGNGLSRRSFKNSEEYIYPSVLSAARSGCIKATARFLARNPPPDVNQVDLDGNTALMLASRHGRKEIVAMLLAHQQSPDINHANVNDDTVLTSLIGTSQRHTKIAAMLLINSLPTSTTPTTVVTPLSLLQ